MRRAEVSHILRAARSLTNETEFVLVGSQAAHVSIADLPEVMQQSGELDIYPLRQPELADVIDGAIGEGSPFHATFGYYAQGVGPETAKLPRGWRDRALRSSDAMTEGAIGIAPEIHDLCVSKLIALREKDFEYVGAAIEARLVEPALLLRRLDEIDEIPEEVRARASAWITTRTSDRPSREGEAR
jgi:hypothetical protein